MSDKVKHTPGPWRYYRNPKNGIFLLSGGDESKNQCFPVLLSQDNTCEQSNPREANANLIAAAPDMLEALIAVVKHCEWRYVVQGGSHGTLEKVYEQSKQVIAKATGNE